MAIVAYPMRKQKSHDICRAFVEGCAGALVIGAQKLYPGTPFFYGVDDSNECIWRATLAEKRQFLYCDNSYFDEARQKYFRVTSNGTQHTGKGTSDGARFEALGIGVKDWADATSAGHVVVCPQSDHFMRVVAGYEGEWLDDVLRILAACTQRSVRVRDWGPNKGLLANTLDKDLVGAHCLATWSSAAAVSALLRGVPVLVSDASPAWSMGSRYEHVERPVRPEGRREWASVLADNQWTLDEFRDGTAWRMLQ